MKETAICTIAAHNYLSQVKTLTESYLKHHPDSEVYVLMLDKRRNDLNLENEKFKTIYIEDIKDGIPDLWKMAFQYQVVEFATSVKPFFLKYLFKTHKFNSLVYLDPDILVMASMKPIFDLLKKNSIVLTPHMSQPIEDSKMPSEINILVTGTYNLGFIGLSATKEAFKLLNWWSHKLKRFCLNDTTRGYFVDQKWMDLVPSYFNSVYLLKDPGVNLAYWNFHERKVTCKNNKFFSNNKRIVFAHFSGYDPKRPLFISRYQTRTSFKNNRALKKLFSFYGRSLFRNGFRKYSVLPYSFDYFDNGVKINLFFRKWYWNMDAETHFFSNPFETENKNSFFYWLLNSQAGDLPPVVMFMREQRQDVLQRYPTIAGQQRLELLKWAVASGCEEFGFDRRIKEILNFTLHCEQRDFFEAIKMANAITAKSSEMNAKILSGVNLVGHFRSETGMGAAGRADIACLEKLKMKFILNNMADYGSSNIENLKDGMFGFTNPYPINLLHINAVSMEDFVRRWGAKYFENKYNIGYWVWETESFPNEWQSAFKYLNEIWVPSTFVQQSVVKISPHPVLCVPHPISVNIQPQFDKKSTRLEFKIPEDNYVFLFMFDFHSYYERKNPAGLIKSFLKTFSRREKVTLVIKCSHVDFSPAEYSELRELANRGNIIIINQIVSHSKVHELLRACDAYVSLHRAEGFGLTMAEAMAYSKPTVATAYSGNMDFMNSFNSYLVPYKKKVLEANFGPYKMGDRWAEPDLDEASKIMRYIYENQEEAELKGKVAALDIEQNMGVNAVSKIYGARLNWIMQHHNEVFFEKHKQVKKIVNKGLIYNQRHLEI